MGETIIKGRKRGEITPFSQLSTTGEVTNLPGLGTLSIVDTSKKYEKGNLSLYCPLIPLSYVTTSIDNSVIYDCNIDGNAGGLMEIFFRKEYTKEEWESTYRNKFFNHPMRNIIWRGFQMSGGNGEERIMQGVMKYLESHISFDAPVNIGHLCCYITYKKDEALRYFLGQAYNPYRLFGFKFRSYLGYISPYSIWIKAERDYEPHILAVIRAEDWVYQRLYMLLYNSIDLSKVIILVDNRVDGNFPYNAFKGFYKGQLEPELKRLSCPVFKVPHEYIIQNCTIQPFQLQEKNIFKRKQAVEDLVDQFYNKYGEKLPNSTNSQDIGQIAMLESPAGISIVDLSS